MSTRRYLVLSVLGLLLVGAGILLIQNREPSPASSMVEGQLVQKYDGEFFTLRLPAGYTPNADHAYQSLGPNKEIYGTSFTVSAATTEGTNLSRDSYISVESIPNVDYCSADLFLDVPGAGMASDGTLSVATSSDAAAGNRYEETVYALPDTNPCVAVRYFIHYGAIENYPEGAVREFDKDALLKELDLIRSTLVLVP